MPEPVYFQWQNDILLKSIYPLRGMKLRDFLVFYQEIDLWKVYEKKTDADLAQDRADYKEAMMQAIVQALSAYKSLRAYFSSPVPNPPTPRIAALHKVFQDNIARVRDIRGERYFVTTSILNWENSIREEQQRVARNKKRALIFRTDSFPHNDKEIDTLEAEARQIEEVILPAMKAELKQLNDYLSGISRIEKRKTEVAKLQQDRQSRRSAITRTLEALKLRARPLEMQQKAIESETMRIKNPPNYASLEPYFLTPNVSETLRAQFGDIDPRLLQLINGIHVRVAEILRFTNSNIEEARGVGEQAEKLRAYKDARETSQKVIAFELQRLEDFRAALRYGKLGEADRSALLTQKETERAEVLKKLGPLQSEIAATRTSLSEVEKALARSGDEELLEEAAPKTPTLREIANWKAEAYRDSLKNKTENQLLEMVVDRFLAEPDRYPLWLQYMVIHFSGMRYRSAHGSWADPKDLLFNLRSNELGSRKDIDLATVSSLCEEKLKLYRPLVASEAPKSATKPGGDALPTLDQSTEKTWRDKIKHHVKGMESSNPYTQKEALFNLMLDEENYAIQKMSGQEALAALEKYKKEIPPVMWKEIESLTQLRLNTTDEQWETLSPDELTERNKAEWARYREILNKWKADNLTEWRQEHDLTSQLIVTRAVCNETAEHIQHIRGHSPAGGLTAKPLWYKNQAGKAAPTAPEAQRPFFRKARGRADFKSGASILWLRFVKDFPNQWRIAQPITVDNNEELLPAGFLSGQASAQTGGWSYQIDSGGIKRTRKRTDPVNGEVTDLEWLRWIHEATVVEVAETAGGTVVLTFETALPYEDRNTSTIGIFKHQLNNLYYNIQGEVFNGTFIGYVPEGQVPIEGLEYMLDWNKILRHKRLDNAALADFRASHIRKSRQDSPPVAFSVDVTPPEPPKPRAKNKPGAEIN